MRPNAVLLLSFLLLGAVCCAAYLVYRLRRLAAERADAEARSAAALEEMTRLTRELRARQGDRPDNDPGLTPGERLQRRYPGQAAKRGGSAG